MKTLLLILLALAATVRGQEYLPGNCIVMNQSCDYVRVEAVMWVWVQNPYSVWSTNCVMPPHSLLHVPAPFVHTDTVGVDTNGSTYWLWRPWVNGNLGLFGQTAVVVGNLCTNGVLETNLVSFPEPVYVRCRLPGGGFTNRLWKLIRGQKTVVGIRSDYSALN